MSLFGTVPTVPETLPRVSRSDVQHWVPQLLLKAFAHGKRKQVYVFDKLTDETFRTGTRNIAGEKGFYDVNAGGGVVSIDPALSKLEDQAAVVLNQIRGAQSLRTLTSEGKTVLAMFIAVQHLRSKQFRENLADTDPSIRGHFACRWR